MYVSNDYYLLVRHWDRIFRETASGYVLHCNTFITVAIVSMMENDLVKCYCSKILDISNTEEGIAMTVLEYIVCLFIAIKGHA